MRTAPTDSPTLPPPNNQGTARVLMPSLRRVCPQAAWCSNYEFEDLIAAVDDADLVVLEPGPGFALRRRLAPSLAWRRWPHRLGGLNPGVRPVAVERDYDLFVFVCMNVWDLLHLNAIRGWRERCRIKVCVMVEFYAGQVPRFDHLLAPLNQFDLVFQSFGGSVPAVARSLGRACHHLPLAADVLRFSPYPSPPARVIDFLSMGRRSVMVHQALLQLAVERGLFYLHDTIPGALVQPVDPVQHRDQLAATAKRSRFFVAYPAKFGTEEHQGQSEVGARYFEGLAAGAVLLGQAPTAETFARDFPWPDAVVEAAPDGGDLAAVVSRLEERPGELRRLAVRNAVHALRHHDWGHRWAAILELAGLPPHPGLAERLRHLEGLARGAEQEDRCA